MAGLHGSVEVQLSHCRQGDIDHPADNQKFIFPLKNTRQQTAVQEYLRQRNINRKDIVTELAGSLATASKRVQIIEKDYMVPALPLA